MAGFTHEYLSLINYYLWVQKCTTGVTHECFQLVSNFLHAVYFSCRMSPTRQLSSNYLEAWSVTHVFVNLDVNCTVVLLYYYYCHYYTRWWAVCVYASCMYVSCKLCGVNCKKYTYSFIVCYTHNNVLKYIWLNLSLNIIWLL